MHVELFKKHRPKTLSRVLGNEETIISLRNMLKRETLPHTILFHGPSGCGKTTLARILAEAVGCAGLGLIEMNAANTRGIDSIREIFKISFVIVIII